MATKDISAKIKELLVWGYPKLDICERLSIGEKEFDAAIGVLFHEYKVDDYEALISRLLDDMQ